MSKQTIIQPVTQSSCSGIKGFFSSCWGSQVTQTIVKEVEDIGSALLINLVQNAINSHISQINPDLLTQTQKTHLATNLSNAVQVTVTNVQQGVNNAITHIIAPVVQQCVQNTNLSSEHQDVLAQNLTAVVGTVVAQQGVTNNVVTQQYVVNNSNTSPQIVNATQQDENITQLKETVKKHGKRVESNIPLYANNGQDHTKTLCSSAIDQPLYQNSIGVYSQQQSVKQQDNIVQQKLPVNNFDVKENVKRHGKKLEDDFGGQRQWQKVDYKELPNYFSILPGQYLTETTIYTNYYSDGRVEKTYNIQHRPLENYHKQFSGLLGDNDF